MLLLTPKWKFCKLSVGEEVDRMQGNYIFHVHTRRCKHASDEKDEQYIEQALRLGAKEIVFTDHAPFPDNPFTNRMDYDELPEYVESILKLQSVYKDCLEVHVGLEIEYLPSYQQYYRDLKQLHHIELLMIGQHHYEIKKDEYSFMMEDKKLEHIGLVNAMLQGMDTKLFDVVAHPDRVFRRVKVWTPELTSLSEKIIHGAQGNGVYLEKNYRSYMKKNCLRDDFWDLVPETAKVVYGCDAHATRELLTGQKIAEEMKREKNNNIAARRHKIRC